MKAMPTQPDANSREPMIRLAEGAVASLLREPESGMGYQFTEATFFDGTIKTGIAYNAELFVPGNDLLALSNEAIFEGLVKAANSTSGYLIKSIRVTSDPPVAVANIMEKISAFSAEQRRDMRAKGKPAKENPQESSKKDEVFLRFCAYQNDRRINPDGSLLPGTYATTLLDGCQVKTGTEAVERYALPDPKPASHRFWLYPPEKTVIRRGIVEPAFGHKGGGVEVVFDNGAPAGTKKLQNKIPDK